MEGEKTGREDYQEINGWSNKGLYQETGLFISQYLG
jgi:hypothetical protein